MELIKKSLGRILKLASKIKTKKQKIIIGGVGVLLLSIAYLSFLMLSIGRSEIALVELKKSFTDEPVCHEECYLWRQGQEALLVNDLKKGKQRTAKVVLNYWENTEVSLEFKKELIRINHLAYGDNNIPSYFKDYLNRNDSKQELVEEIISVFKLDLPSANSLGVKLNSEFSLASSSAEKIAILKTMAKLDSDLEIDNYFIVLNSAEDLDVKLQLIKNISAVKDKVNYFTLEQLKEIKDLVSNQDCDIRLRQNLVLLVGDYYLIYPEESSVLWQEIYDNQSLDNISRLFSADSLNHLVKTNLVLPEVSPSDWESYYNK